MSRGKVAIVVLVALGAIVALGAGSSLMKREWRGDDLKGVLNDPDSKYRKGWFGSVGSSLQSLSPKLDRSRLRLLSPGSQCRLLDDIIEIEAGAGCEVEIARQATACGDDHQVARLRLLGAGASPGEARRLPERAAVGRPRPGLAAAAPAVGTAEVIYRARFNGGDKPETGSVGADDMRLVVMPAGGRLVLRCLAGCEGRPLRLALNGRPSCR